MPKNLFTNSAADPQKLVKLLNDIPPEQRLRVVAICFNPEPPPTDPTAKWIAFLEPEEGA
jgi:hypothetical protein